MMSSPVATGHAFIAVFAILFAEMVTAFYEPDPDTMASKAQWLMIAFFITSVASALFRVLQPYLFGVAGERMTRRLRVDAFTSLLRQVRLPQLEALQGAGGVVGSMRPCHKGGRLYYY